VFVAPDTLIVTESWAEQAIAAAEDAAKAAVARLPALLPCKPEGAEEACARRS